MSHPKGYVDSDYLQLVAKMVAQYKQRTYALMRIEPGHSVLDVGCGPGTDTIPLAQLVGDTGQVVGVDYDEAMIAEADQRAKEAGVSPWVVHRHADATALPFESATFDSSRSERLFQHLPDPEPALSEMIRVTRSGGWVVVLDTDFNTLSLDTAEVEIEQRLKSYRLEHHVHNAFAGRQLYRLFKQQGLVDVSVEMCPIYGTDYAVVREGAMLDEVEEGALAAGWVTSDELRRWRTSLEQADAQGVHFGSVNQTMVAGRKP
jgi:ubiquinone/menaquinone biosynthesis C-methylase UbiE